MKSSLFISFIIVLFLSAGVFFTTTYAQSAQVPQDDIVLTIIPENPGPNQTVSASVVSYSTDINAATITWKINGKTQKSGVGQKTFQFITGNVNNSTTLDIIVETKEGQVITKTLNIKPVSVDLIWQSDGLVPPFYKGRILFSHQNKITFIALPHITGSSGTEISAKNLIYKWTRNGTVMDSDSGYGKNTYTMTGSLISRPLDIEVEVTGTNTSVVGRAQTSVEPIDPSIILYRENPLYGIEFQKALIDTVELKDSKEIAIVSMPFFFGVSNYYSGELLYKWSVNGVPIDADRTQTTRVFRQKEGASGVSNISLEIENRNKILQLASSRFNLSFGK